ncbi:calcium-activated potassium channel subunit beta-1 isoform X3 [Notamacropus eugenii]|uniref:calcium-activated potassium channel subunit beta-1 isoform X3 n=1 Tax=Notamacropus eugenii TaxID=9315 RepID=UPI003B67A032
MGKNLVTAQIRGETRALCLGAVMVVCSAITYYILGTTVLPLHQKSVWSKASICHLIETDIRDHEKLDGKKVPQYPCLWVNVSAIGKSAILYHTEETKEKNCQLPALPTITTPEALGSAFIHETTLKGLFPKLIFCLLNLGESSTYGGGSGMGDDALNMLTISPATWAWKLPGNKALTSCV